MVGLTLECSSPRLTRCALRCRSLFDPAVKCLPPVACACACRYGTWVLDDRATAPHMLGVNDPAVAPSAAVSRDGSVNSKAEHVRFNDAVGE
jgi:hypothetical protein